jgi:hypothetical protein
MWKKYLGDVKENGRIVVRLGLKLDSTEEEEEVPGEETGGSYRNSSTL